MKETILYEKAILLSRLNEYRDIEISVDTSHKSVDIVCNQQDIIAVNKMLLPHSFTDYSLSVMAR